MKCIPPIRPADVRPTDIQGGWPTGNGKKLSSSQAQVGQATCLLLFRFFPFPVGHPMSAGCRKPPSCCSTVECVHQPLGRLSPNLYDNKACRIRTDLPSDVSSWESELKFCKWCHTSAFWTQVGKWCAVNVLPHRIVYLHSKYVCRGHWSQCNNPAFLILWLNITSLNKISSDSQTSNWWPLLAPVRNILILKLPFLLPCDYSASRL